MKKSTSTLGELSNAYAGLRKQEAGAERYSKMAEVEGQLQTTFQKVVLNRDHSFVVRVLANRSMSAPGAELQPADGRPAQCTNDAATLGTCAQGTLRALFPAATAGSFTVYAAAPGGKLAAYGSMVDNQSADPVYFPGR